MSAQTALRTLLNAQGLSAALPHIFPTENSVRIASHRRRIPHFKSAGKILYDLDEVVAYLTRNRVAPADEVERRAAEIAAK